MRKVLIFSFVSLSFLSLLFSCKKDGGDIAKPNPVDTTQTGNNAKLIFPQKDMRAVWIATVYGLDWPQGDYDIASQKQQYLAYLDKFVQLHINAIFFQVKAKGDAFYNSPYEPWSAAITGTRGKGPGYDVLKFMIDEAHKRDIEFHAWMNPYRIDTRASSSDQFDDLPATIKPEWVLNLNKIQIYNPALPEVRQRLVDIVKDLITKYDVDGIHFDDYFYPADETIPDQDDYKKYGSGYSTVEDFRRANVDKAIKAVHDVIVNTKPGVVFSVSPAPNEDYNYNTLFADVTKWCQEGWIDVVIPQLYHEIGNKYNDFQKNLNWWSHYNYKAALMVGYGYYRFGDPNAPAAFQSTTELEQQMNLVRRNSKVVGDVLYSAKYIMLNKIGITNKLASLYHAPTVIPFLGRHVSPAPMKPKDVRIENGELKWTVSDDSRSVVYYFSSLNKEGQVYSITTKHSLSVSTHGYYCITTLNPDNQESEPSDLVELK